MFLNYCGTFFGGKYFSCASIVGYLLSKCNLITSLLFLLFIHSFTKFDMILIKNYDISHMAQIGNKQAFLLLKILK